MKLFQFGACLCLSLAVPVFAASEEQPISNTTMPEESTFDYGVPSTFHAANAEQGQFLLEVANSEFSLDHLSDEDQALLTEALQFSGVEVARHCQVEKNATTEVKAFFRKYNESEHKYFDPEKGMLDMLPKSESEEPPPEPSWHELSTDFHEYPYPFSEELVIPKTIAVDLSSIQPTERNENTAKFKADPSRLLYGKLPPDDRLWDRLKMVVHFEVDLNTKRVTNQTLMIEKPTRVFFGIRVTRFSLHYHFSDDEGIGRNVMNKMNQLMRGRMYLVTSAQFEVDGDYTYSNCQGDLPTKSYLYQAMDSIASL